MQVLGRSLAELTAAELAAIPVWPELEAAIVAAHGLERAALRRQVRYIARVLREGDAEPVEQALEVVRRKLDPYINVDPGTMNPIQPCACVPRRMPGFEVFSSAAPMSSVAPKTTFSSSTRLNRCQCPRVAVAWRSMLNTVVGKPFSKRQPMRWSRAGAHLMLQTRPRVLDHTLRAKLQRWHPGLFNVRNAGPMEHVRAA